MDLQFYSLQLITKVPAIPITIVPEMHDKTQELRRALVEIMALLIKYS
ncbi:hypothetical protein Mpsy_1592 [Methanolobus psychrophilus R15]|nr:hypothetical protein Mpsy_1592 [Methanolobus psychrophilus R15]